MHVFITGATGFLGAHALAAIVEAGHDVAALVRPGTDRWRIEKYLDAIDVIPGSLDDTDAFADAFNRFGAEAVVNLAWAGVSNRTHNDPAQPENLTRIDNLLRLCAGAGVAHWIGLGSQAEYGPRDHPVLEDEPAAPGTAYGKAKLAACERAAAFCYDAGMRFAWLRLFSCYGPMDKESWLIPSVILKLLAGETPALTEGRQRMDYLFASDAAAAIRAAVETPAADGIFNLASGTAVPVREIAERIRDLIDPALGLDFGAVPQSPDAPMLIGADIAKLCAATGWRPRTPLDDGLAATVAWYRDRQPI